MTGDLLVVDRGTAQEAGEPVRWDGKPETFELLRERIPAGVTFFDGLLTVKVLRKVSPRRSVHDEHVVPVGWWVTPGICRHGEAYAVIKSPEMVDA